MYGDEEATILNYQEFFGKSKNKKKDVNVKLLPADSGKKIIFKRIDLERNNILELNYSNTFIENNELILKVSDDIYVRNIEILLASIWAEKLDDLLIEIDDDSVPYIDGTCEPISFLLSIGKRKKFNVNREIFTIKNNIDFKIDNFEISVKPSISFSIYIKNEDSEFLFNNKTMPFKNYLSKINENEKNIAQYNILSVIAMIFISGYYCQFSVEIKNFNKQNVFDFFKKNLFNK